MVPENVSAKWAIYENGTWPLWQVIASSALGVIAVTVISQIEESGSAAEMILVFCLSLAFLNLSFCGLTI